MKLKKIYSNLLLVLISDLVLLACCFYAANMARFDFQIPPEHQQSFKTILPLALLTKIAVLHIFDLYRGMWRYTSLADLLNIIKASTISTLLIICYVLLRYRFEGFSRSVFLIDWCFSIIMVAGFRLSIRVYFVHFSERQSLFTLLRRVWRLFTRKQGDKKNLLIIGAGDCGEKIYREIRDSKAIRYNIVGFLDDDPDKIGKKIHGVPILSHIEEIDIAVKKLHVDETIIAIPSANAQQIRKIVSLCKQSGAVFKTVPSLSELINGKVSINAIREVAYHDLLGREVIKLDEAQIGSYLKNKHVMITGAGGSIGSELCRQICRYGPKCIVLYDRGESALYEIDLEIRQYFKHIDVRTLLADIRDRKQLAMAFESTRPHVVFHAAAYKHVPMLETQPWKAVKNNIKGSRNLIEFSLKYKVERFVFVSTDKAVRPTNVMGASKRVAEMLVQNQNINDKPNTQFMIVRFGNVVGSVGSVVPLFKKQIAKGGPVTVTHPDMTRYFMTIPEACQLICQAGAMGEGGEIFILDMGTSIKIDDMARDLIRLSGFEPDVDIKIEYVGIRPGEKLYEELITEGEGIIPTDHEKIMVLKGSVKDLPSMNGKIDELIELADNQNGDQIKAKLKSIVPEYSIYDK
jgi:FlaA1/EpsC-like NDP-sugar epimerase